MSVKFHFVVNHKFIKNSFWPEKKISVKNVFQFRLHNNSDTKVFLNKQTIFTKKYSSWKSSIMFTTTISQCIWVFFYFLFTFIIISELFSKRPHFRELLSDVENISTRQGGNYFSWVKLGFIGPFFLSEWVNVYLSCNTESD